MTEEQLTDLLNNGKIEELVDNGITEKQLMEAFDFKKKEWGQFKGKYPELKKLCDRASGLGYLEAQATLLKRAKGYYYTEEHQEIPIDTTTGKPKGEGVLIKNKKWSPPDPDALNKILSTQLLLSINKEDE